MIAVVPTEGDRIAHLAVLIDHLRPNLRGNRALEADRPYWPTAVQNHRYDQSRLHDLTLPRYPRYSPDQNRLFGWNRLFAQGYFPTSWIDFPLTLAGYPTSRLQRDAGAENQRSCDLPYAHTTARAGTSPMFRPKNWVIPQLH